MAAEEKAPFWRQLGFSAGGSQQSPNWQVSSAGVITASAASSFTSATMSSNLTFTAVGVGPILKQGTNALVGTFTLNGTTPVTVSNTAVAITDAIPISLNTVGGTVGVQPHIATITAATGFTVVGTASDTSIYNYALIKSAA